MLDARPLDIESSARCQGRPGDDFVSVFSVGRKKRDRSDYDDDQDDDDHDAHQNQKQPDAYQPVQDSPDYRETSTDQKYMKE